jgi:chloride channel protein, CIC family
LLLTEQANAFFPGHAQLFRQNLSHVKALELPADHKDDHRQIAHERRSLSRLAATAFIIGAATGCVGAIFRFLLTHGDRLRETMITWTHGHAVWRFLIVVGVCAVATLVAAWMVRRFSPHASGSGIPHVEAVLQGEIHRLRLCWCQ